MLLPPVSVRLKPFHIETPAADGERRVSSKTMTG